MPKQKWFTTAPTEDGYYWAIRKGVRWANGPVPELVSIIRGDEVITFGYDVSDKLTDFSHWQGPLLEPERPE